MAMLDDNTRRQIQEAFADFTQDVEIVVYTGGRVYVPGRDMPEHERQLLDLLREVAALHERVTLSERPLSGDAEATAAGIEQASTFLLREAGSERTNIRFLGTPGGYEFATLIQAIRMLATGEVALDDETRKALDGLEEPVRLQTFVTPTCPYCPRAVLTGYRFAFHSPKVIAEGIEATDFPRLAQRHRISSVPDTIITAQGTERVLGAQPDRAYVQAIARAVAPATSPRA